MSEDAGRLESAGRPYALGYSEREFRRLERQSAFYRDLTEDVFRRAGIKPGMRVLDMGCGVGDVSLIVSEFVGPSGFVLGVDRSQESIDTAARRIDQAGRSSWVKFATADLSSYTPEAGFDAVVGRFILLYLPDPAGALRRVTAALKPGGILVCQEMAVTMMRSFPDGPLFRQCVDWFTDTVGRAGFEIDMGPRLRNEIQAAGLPPPQMIAASRVEGGSESFAYDYITETLRSLLPVVELTGVATREEVGIDSLAERLRAEALGHSACLMMPPLVGAWTVKPA